MHDRLRTFRYELLAALAAFVVAAITGALYRLGVAAGGLPLDLTFGNVRHAHSHLMLFSWVTPVLMAVIAAIVATPSTLKGFRWTVRAAIFFGAASYVPFILWGYDPVAIGDAHMPISVIFSTAAMIAWYVFAFVYWRARRQRRSALPATGLFDLAVILLVVSTAGAWGRGAVMAMGIDDPLLTNATLHFFLALFADGWLAVGTLGVLHSSIDVHWSFPTRAATTLIAFGIPTVFLPAIPAETLPFSAQVIGMIGGGMVGFGFAVHAWQLSAAAKGGLWRFPAVFLGLKGIGQMLYAVPGAQAELEALSVRIPYLHLLFLGFVSVGLMEFVRRYDLFDRYVAGRPFHVAVLIMLVTMLPTTGIWPEALAGDVALYAVVIGALAPAVVGTWIVVASFRESSDDDQRRSKPSMTRR